MGQNGAPPTIDLQPLSKSLPCTEIAPIDSLTNWYTENGGMQVSGDNPISIEGTMTLDSAITVFENSTENLCGNTKKVSLQFVATDADGESTVSEEVHFEIVDNLPPDITKQAKSVSLSCDGMARDSFISWIQGHGGAVAIDACSDAIWTAFIWNDSEGNNGTASIENGPYPPFPAGCSFSYNIAFVVQDSCGNEVGTLSSFSVVDDVAPVFSGSQKDTTILCHQVLPSTEIPITDACDSAPTVVFSESNTQHVNVDSCGHYTYTVQRKWIATDACENVDSVQQLIHVVDTLPPSIEATDTLIIGCDAFKTDSIYIGIKDQCGNPTISYQDSILADNSCTQHISRTYTAVDACQNMQTYSQVLMISDTVAPVWENDIDNYFINCDTLVDAEQAFTSWLATLNDLTIRDACSTASYFVARPGSYTLGDTSTYPGSIPKYEDSAACGTAGFGRMLSQKVDVVLYDSCGNVNVEQLEFAIIDNTPPMITACIEDITLSSADNNCLSDVTIPQISVVDACSDRFGINDYRYSISINNGPETSISGDGTDILSKVPQGKHLLRYTIRDCSGNKTSCDFRLTIEDALSPMISCPPSINSTISDDMCERKIAIGENIHVEDNCALEDLYRQRQPREPKDALLSYVINENDTTILNKSFTFSETSPIEFGILKPQLLLDITAAKGTVFTIFGEDNTPLSTHTTTENCSLETVTIELDTDQFNGWAADGALGIAISIEYASNGVCGSIAEGTDGTSSLQATLLYSDAKVEYSISGAAAIPRSILSKHDSITLPVGRSSITYYAKDNAGNIDSCMTEVRIIDPISPEAICKNITLEIPPQIDIKHILSAAEINDGSFDNCGIDTLYVRNNILSCDMYDKEINRTLIVVDSSGRKDSCSARINVVPTAFEPSYTAGVCQGDTLRFFANAPVDSTGNRYTYSWSGPNFSSGLQNPTIINASSANNGTYTVTITGEGGCSASATIDVRTSILSTPEIKVNNTSDTICAGQEVILQTDTYTGDIMYQWFEGLFPDGLPIGESVQPSLIIEPTPGIHNYYVVARSKSCSSNPSAVLRITAVEPPEAVLSDPFLNICEGENIQLSTSTLGNQYTYDWSGPNDFTSTRPIPPVIENASTLNQGTYALTIRIGGCASQPATTKVNIFPKPATPIISGADLFCEDASFTLTVNNVPQADKYQWFLNETLFTVTDENRLFIPNTTSNLEGEWHVLLEVGGCTSDASEAKTINVNDLSDITASFIGNPCQGDSIQLLATFITDANYSWVGPEGFTSSVQNPKIPAVPGEYIVTATTPNQCTTISSVNIMTQEAPTITALTTDTQNCMNLGDSISFFPSIVPAGGDYNYLWSGPNGFVSTDKTLTIKDISSENRGLYSLTVYKGNCASNVYEVPVDFTFFPEKPQLSVEGNACLGDSFAIVATSSENASYIWETPNGELSTDSPKYTINDASNNDDWNYRITAERNGCRSPISDVLVVDVVPVPDAVALNHNGPLCIGDTLTVSGPEAYSYTWFSNMDTLSEERQLNVFDIDPTKINALSYTVTEAYCTSGRYPVKNIEVYEALPQPILSENSYFVCNGRVDKIELCIKEGYLDNTNYTVQNFLTSDEIHTSSDSCFIINDFSKLNLGNNIMILRADRNGCSSSDSPKINIRVSDVPDIAASTLEDAYYTCSDTVTVRSQHGTPQVRISWKKIDEHLELPASTVQRIQVQGVKTGENKLILSYSQGGCLDYSQDTVLIYGEYEPEAIDDSFVTEVGQSLGLDILSNDTYPQQFTVEIIDQPDNGTLKLVENTYIYVPNDGYAGTDEFVYRLCSPVCESCKTAEVRILVDDGNVCSGINIITPNGDNINDALVFPCLTDENIKGSLTVFNQWGQEVYRNEDYKNDWEGTYNGNDLPVGTYFYILEANGGKSNMKDYITIQR